ncbi:DUF2157 domain-containing protein [bacterium]|nr:DUF2157 domain-containing protein [bacterium]
MISEVAEMCDRQQWPPLARARAYQLATAPATRAEWVHFLDHGLLAGGSLCILAGCIFFVAANWSLLGAFAKFLLLSGLIAASAGYAWKTGLEQLRARWALTVSSGLVGAYLALYGQVYQSGADPYTLFLGWALLILPWTLLLRFAPAWALWLVVANTSLSLASESFVLVGVANLGWWALTQRWTPRLGWPQLPLAASWVGLTTSAFLNVVDGGDGAGLLAWAVWLLVVGGHGYLYRQKGNLAALGFSAVVLLTAALGQNIRWHDLSWFFVMGLAVIVQVTLLVAALRRLPE